MNKKFLIAWILIFVLWMAGSILVHGILLGPDARRPRGRGLGSPLGFGQLFAQRLRHIGRSRANQNRVVRRELGRADLSAGGEHAHVLQAAAAPRASADEAGGG